MILKITPCMSLKWIDPHFTPKGALVNFFCYVLSCMYIAIGICIHPKVARLGGEKNIYVCKKPILALLDLKTAFDRVPIDVIKGET